MNRSFAVLTLVVTLFAWKAYSAIELEPYIGYQASAASGTNGDYTQLNIGGRAGLSFLGLSLGADYLSGTGDGENDSSSSYDVTATDMGVYLKYTFPILLQVYATYILDHEWKIDFGATSFKYEGDGMKAGLGFTFLPLVAINFEYKKLTYDSLDSVALTTEVDTESYGISISLPLTF